MKNTARSSGGGFLQPGAPLAGLVGAICLGLVGCASAAGDGAGRATFEGGEGLYRLTLNQGFKRAPAGHSAFDRVFHNREGSIFVAVITDAQALPLTELDEVVAVNLDNYQDPGTIKKVVAIENTSLDAIPARRTEIFIQKDGLPMVMFNTHGATETHSFQLLVWGPQEKKGTIKALVDLLENQDFDLAKGSQAFVEGPLFALDDPKLPIRFSDNPEGWRPTRKGTLHDDADLEMVHQKRDLFFMALVTDSDTLGFEEVYGHMWRELEQFLSPTEPGGDAPRDVVQTEKGRRWSQIGRFVDGGMDITYRLRLFQSGRRFFQLYCWGQTEIPDATQRCDALYDLIEPRSAKIETPPKVGDKPQPAPKSEKATPTEI
jgi:hypothetical protein